MAQSEQMKPLIPLIIRDTSFSERPQKEHFFIAILTID
jgi:hypothetical protein